MPARVRLPACARLQSGSCRFGGACDFAHGEHELSRGPRMPAIDANTLVIQVQTSQLGSIMGKGGTRIQEMRNSTGAKIQASAHPFPHRKRCCMCIFFVSGKLCCSKPPHPPS